jgi:hypothetical protein
MDSLPYLHFTYDLPISDGVARVHVCVNLVDARCVGVGISESASIRHMETIWDGLHEDKGFEDAKSEGGCQGRFGDK